MPDVVITFNNNFRSPKKRIGLTVNERWICCLVFCQKQHLTNLGSQWPDNCKIERLCDKNETKTTNKNTQQNPLWQTNPGFCVPNGMKYGTWLQGLGPGNGDGQDSQSILEYRSITTCNKVCKCAGIGTLVISFIWFTLSFTFCGESQQITIIYEVGRKYKNLAQEMTSIFLFFFHLHQVKTTRVTERTTSVTHKLLILLQMTLHCKRIVVSF